MDHFDKSTCWYNSGEIAASMLKAYEQSQPDFYKLPHIQALIELIKLIPKGKEKKMLVDIGCGTAQISQLFSDFLYMGADLDFVIDGCARKLYPQYMYIHFDTENSSYNLLNSADVFLLNGFIDVMQYPLEELEKVFQADIPYILLHRQEISISKPTQTIKKDSYCGQTYHSIINAIDFSDLLIKYNYEIIKTMNCGFGDWENGGWSSLLKKRLDA